MRLRALVRRCAARGSCVCASLYNAYAMRYGTGILAHSRSAGLYVRAV